MSPLIIGHRGAPGYLPEHTRASYELAFASGVDAGEPDVVATKDGVLVVRHENEISGTTDVADHPEFAHLHTTKTFGGVSLTGWFTEDFTWPQLQTLRCRERLPEIRRASASHDGEQRMLRLVDLLELLAAQPRQVGLVLEIKHAAYFAAIGLDLVPMIERDLAAYGWTAPGMPLWFESFEPTVLFQLKDRALPGTYIYLMEADGSPVDLVMALGENAPTYRAQMSSAGLDEIAREFDGISLDKRIILAPNKLGHATGPARVVAEAKARGLRVFTWTARPENRFLVRQFRTAGPKSAFGDYHAEWQLLKDAQLDGVFVDHPDLGVAFFR